MMFSPASQRAAPYPHHHLWNVDKSLELAPLSPYFIPNGFSENFFTADVMFVPSYTCLGEQNFFHLLHI